MRVGYLLLDARLCFIQREAKLSCGYQTERVLTESKLTGGSRPGLSFFRRNMANPANGACQV